MSTNTQATTSAPAVVITPQALLHHWQEHRRLTRRVIEAFPEKELFEFSIGGMRSFAGLAMEMIDIAGPGIRGLATDEWSSLDKMSHYSGEDMPAAKAALLELWDKVTEEINNYWPQISLQRFQEPVLAFGQYEGTVYSILFYFIDNEIHHRGQGYVYLRALGIEPPPFWDRH